MKIFIGGDLSPTKENFELFSSGDGQKLYTNEILEYLKDFDFRIFNFESVIEGSGSYIQKNGPYITCPEKCLPGIKCLNPDLFVLANNHANNLGPDGISHTISTLKKNGISCIGAGMNKREASKPYFFENNGLIIGFYACAEHEFNSCSINEAGVNPYDPLETFDDIRSIKNQCDFLIVLYHGGQIQFRYPLITEQRALRKMIDSGADLVIGQHTHCIGCEEIYKDKHILYGQGDFLFARPTNNEYRYSGLFVALEINGKDCKINYKVRLKPNNTIKFANKDEEKKILGDFYKRSEILHDKKKYQDIYEKYLDTQYSKYVLTLLGNKRHNIVLRGINKIFKHSFFNAIIRKNFHKQDLLELYNYLTCETHYEIFTDLLKREF